MEGEILEVGLERISSKNGVLYSLAAQWLTQNWFVVPLNMYVVSLSRLVGSKSNLCRPAALNWCVMITAESTAMSTSGNRVRRDREAAEDAPSTSNGSNRRTCSGSSTEGAADAWRGDCASILVISWGHRANGKR
ncbi:hypothetical protein H2248_010501 [Termitomyces sp. 'cryptogamus']|nr:hypothetical protein H2248_010501 [Termitomyces sp. 'cryptogamus']